MPARTNFESEATELSRRQVLARLGLAASVAYAAPALFTLSEARASGASGAGGSGSGGSGESGGGTGGESADSANSGASSASGASGASGGSGEGTGGGATPPTALIIPPGGTP